MEDIRVRVQRRKSGIRMSRGVMLKDCKRDS